MSETHLTGTVSGKFDWNEYQIEYTANVSGTEWYQKGRMYMPNGDPGYPDEYDSEGPFFEDIDCVYINDKDGVEVPEDDKIYESNRDMIDQLVKEDVEENKDWDDCNWDDPEPDYPDPPEPDDEED